MHYFFNALLPSTGSSSFTKQLRYNALVVKDSYSVDQILNKIWAEENFLTMKVIIRRNRFHRKASNFTFWCIVR